MAVLGWLLVAAPVTAAEPTDVAWSVGWDHIVKLGRWSLATAEFTLAEPQDCQLECVASDADGHQAVYTGPAVTLPAGRHRLQTPFQIARPDGSVTLRLKQNKSITAQTVLRGDKDGVLRLKELSHRLIVSLGDVKSVTALGTAALRTPVDVVVRTTGDELPDAVAGYAAVDWLVIAGSTAMPEPQSAAIRDWVRDGGRLMLSVPKSLTDIQSSPLAQWLPAQIGAEPVAVRDLGALEAYAGRNLRIPMTGRVTIAPVAATDGVSLASNRSDALLLRVPYGFGEVVILALDLTQPPLANWGAVNDLVRRVVELEPLPTDEKSAAENVRGQLTSTGIGDLASQLGASLDHFPAVRRPSPWWSMVWLLAALVVVGPLDYVLVHRVLRRPHLTWITLPVWLIVFAGVAASAGSDWNQSSARLNQQDVVDVDAASQSVRVNSYATYYSPASQRVALTATPTSAAATARGLNWFYIPESTTGGLYRPAGAEWGRTDYLVEPLAGRMNAVPVLKWSSRSITSRWVETAPNLVEADLQSTGLGRLTGTLTHHLPGPITDWILAFNNRAYRLQVSRSDEATAPFAPDRKLSAEDPLMTQGDLRGLLTRVVLTKEAGDRASETRVRREQTKYDPSHREPHRLWQMVTFHKAAGGTGYTRLQNELLIDDDLTRQLELGRAVLFGRLESPPWITTQINGEQLAADRTDVFVRLVLPVRRSGEVVRELPKFVK